MVGSESLKLPYRRPRLGMNLILTKAFRPRLVCAKGEGRSRGKSLVNVCNGALREMD
jgi:hypothetical protein